MKHITAITVGRSDYGIYRPVLRRLSGDSHFALDLIVSGSHLSPEFGNTHLEIVRDQFTIRDQVKIISILDTPEGMAYAMANGVKGFAKSFATNRPELLLVLGDRAEMHAAVLAALPFNIAVAHIHGGEITRGAIDDCLRHSITKLSHLHFVATQEYARRVKQMGEEPWRVCVCGAPSLDNLNDMDYLSREEIEKQFAISLTDPTVLVTFHPVTLELEHSMVQTDALLRALQTVSGTVIFTMPNADAHGRLLAEKIAEFTSARPSSYFIKHFGSRAYLSLLRLITAMVGNSSSGLIEAPSFQLPVLNIGNRQEGRCRARNVVDCNCDYTSIVEGLQTVLAPSFRQSLTGLVNPYGQGTAADTIACRLQEIPVDATLIKKHFQNLTKE